MRFKPYRKGLPRCWRNPSGKGLVAEADIMPRRYGRLAAKLLIFETPKHLRSFWKQISEYDLGKDCLGAVNGLSVQVEDFREGDKFPSAVFMRGDPRYFCVIGLVKGHLGAEIVTHEAVHAGFAYEKRLKRNTFGEVGSFDEERVAYPAGAIASAINDFCHKKKLY